MDEVKSVGPGRRVAKDLVTTVVLEHKVDIFLLFVHQSLQLLDWDLQVRGILSVRIHKLIQNELGGIRRGIHAAAFDLGAHSPNRSVATHVPYPGNVLAFQFV